jgi:hypothetical protein
LRFLDRLADDALDFGNRQGDGRSQCATAGAAAWRRPTIAPVVAPAARQRPQQQQHAQSPR